ncbi:MAG: phosphatase PAP2 family protein [Acidimicrobiales bacterium]
MALAGWGFGVVVQDVLAGESLNPLDRPVLDFFVRHREPWLTTAAKAATALGSTAVLVPVLAAVAIVYGWRDRTWRPTALFACGYGGAVVLYSLVKVVLRRPRPAVDHLGYHFSGFSFPSGHATQAMVAWRLLAAVATPSWPRKVSAWAAALFIAFVVGVSSVYLGVHWPTDVIAGLAIGALWLSALLTLARTVPSLRRPGPALHTEPRRELPMKKPTRLIVPVLVATAVFSGACRKQDVTKAALDADVTVVFANLQAKRDSLLGEPRRQAVQVESNCYRGGPKQPDVGAGKDWRCDVSEQDATTGSNSRTYLVIVRASGCWTALAETLTAKAETVDVITMTDPRTGADLPDPLGGFDGCVRA